jgi:hypothetical protein
MLGVEAYSSLPHYQHDGGNLPGQGQPCHFLPDAVGHQSCVELLEWTRFARCNDCCAVKQILQIGIAVSVQSANGNLFRHYGDPRCCVSRCQIRCMSIAAACCGNDAGPAGCPATRRPGSGRSTGSGRAVSRPGVSCPPADPAALADAPSAAHRVVSSKTRSRRRTPGSLILASHSAPWRGA